MTKFKFPYEYCGLFGVRAFQVPSITPLLQIWQAWTVDVWIPRPDPASLPVLIDPCWRPFNLPTVPSLFLPLLLLTSLFGPDIHGRSNLRYASGVVHSLHQPILIVIHFLFFYTTSFARVRRGGRPFFSSKPSIFSSPRPRRL